MPQKPPHPCAFPGCPNLIRSGQYCMEHEKQIARAYDAGRGSASSRGYGSKWRGVRGAYLARHPICADPFGVHGAVVVLATQVHHIKPRREGGSDADENLKALCAACHSRITQADSGRNAGKNNSANSAQTGRAGQISTGLHRETERGV